METAAYTKNIYNSMSVECFYFLTTCKGLDAQV